MNTFRTILMPLGMGGEVRERIVGALTVAKHFQSHLDVLFTYVSPKETIPEEIFGMSQSTMDNLRKIADQHAADLAKEREELFLDLCQQNGVIVVDKPTPNIGVTAKWNRIDGLRSSVVALRGRVSDLIIVPRPPASKPSSLIKAAVTESGRPVLLMPRTQESYQTKHIAINWDGGMQTARTLQHAMPCIHEADQVTVFTTADEKDKTPSVADLLDYFAWHNITATVKVLDAQSRSIGEAIWREAESAKVDMLILGGYQQRRVGDLLMENVTQHALATMVLPVLMAN